MGQLTGAHATTTAVRGFHIKTSDSQLEFELVANSYTANDMHRFTFGVFLNLLLVGCMHTVPTDVLVSRANIYYQRPVRYGAPHELSLADVKALDTSSGEFKLIVHGYIGSRRHPSIKPLSNAYLAQGTDNIYLADWADAAALDYPSSRLAVGKVAVHLGKLLQSFLAKHNVSRHAVHVIGHSLGAHIAGGIGSYFNGSLGRVTGLDPALPLFLPGAADSLHATAAQFVDVIHTDYPVFGDLTPRGTADFYPNFGYAPQRGCDDVDLLAASKLIFEAYSCSHNRAVLYYAETIGLPKNYPALPCSLSGIVSRNAGACWQGTRDSDSNKTTLAAASRGMDAAHAVYMGDAVSRSANGVFYLATYETAPYGMGVNTKF